MTEAATRQYVALLRGVNVGRANRISMADLRAIAAQRGYANPRTLLNSGNLVFSAPPAAAARAEAALAASLAARAITTPVFVLPGARLRAILAAHPFADIATDPARMLIAVFAGDTVPPKVIALASQDWGADRFAIAENAAFLWCAGGILESPMLNALARATGKLHTTRNVSTLQKLADMLQE